MATPTRDELQYAIDAMKRGTGEPIPIYSWSDVADLALEALDRREQTCETCRYAGSRFASVEGRPCNLPVGAPYSLVDGRTNIVPLTINGQPFGCRAHERREAATTSVSNRNAVRPRHPRRRHD